MLEPIHRAGKANRISYKNDGGGTHAFFFRQLGQIPQGAENFSLGWQGAVAYDRRGFVFGQSAGNQFVDDLVQFAHSHVNAKRSPGSGKLSKINTQGFLLNVLVSSQKGDRRTIITVGQRNSGISCATKSSSNTGHNLVGYPRIVKGRHFLRATPKNKGVSAFETNHVLSQLRFLDEQFANLFLLNGMTTGCLADVDLLALLRGFGQESGVDQVIVHQNVTG